MKRWVILILLFQSTLPTRGSELIYQPFHFLVFLFQSTLPTRGSDTMVKRLAATDMISIHAPHEGERPVYRIFY